MKYIDNEIILQRKISPLVYVYIMIIIVLILSLIIFCFLCYYKSYYRTRGVIVYEDNEYYIKIYIPLEDIVYITDNNIVKINNKDYVYSVFDIGSEYFTDNNDTFQIIKIKCDLDKKYRFNNLTFDLNFVRCNKRIIDYILK